MFKNNKNVSLRILIIVHCLFFVSAQVTQKIIANGDSPKRFITEAYPSHWGKSDLRAFMNNGLLTARGKKNHKIDSTTSSDNKSGYANQFSNKEWSIIVPTTVKTNTLNSNAQAINTYATTDKIFLPSGNKDSGQIISWGSEDISSNRKYNEMVGQDKNRVIPVSYFAAKNQWLRSHYYGRPHSEMLISKQGNGVGSWHFMNYQRPCGVSAVFKINLKSVIFASVASAAALSNSESQRITIDVSDRFGKKSEDSLPRYGMYLKTKYYSDHHSGSKFEITSLQYNPDCKKLSVNFKNGKAGKYVVVQSFQKGDNFNSGRTSLIAAKVITNDTDTSVDIDVSNWSFSSYLYFKGYTFKVWMEEIPKNSKDTAIKSNKCSLAKATVPQTFYGSSSLVHMYDIDTKGTETKNIRVFATKDDLKCSWGNLAALDSTNYDNIIKGEGEVLYGKNPTNQKIYFGDSDSNGTNPLEFWIAGREDYTGKINESGNIMCLYQAKFTMTQEYNVPRRKRLPLNYKFFPENKVPQWEH